MSEEFLDETDEDSQSIEVNLAPMNRAQDPAEAYILVTEKALGAAAQPCAHIDQLDPYRMLKEQSEYASLFFLYCCTF